MNRNSTSDECLADVLEYHRLGLSVIPLRPDSKKPAKRWTKYQSRSATVDELSDWFDRTDFGVGLVLGPVSDDLACRDFDDFQSYCAWVEAYPDFAEVLPTVMTRRGFHVYFPLAVPEEDVRQRQGTSQGRGAIVLGDGELRLGSGCYCVAPPTRIEDFRYRWVRPLFQPITKIDPHEAGLDRSWKSSTESSSERKICTPPQSPPKSSGNSCSPCVPCVAPNEIECIVQRCLPTKEGVRHRRLFDLARELRSLPEAWDSNPICFEDVFKRWFVLARPHIRTQDRVENWGEFLQSWGAVKHRLGDEPIRVAFTQALNRPLPVCAARYWDTPKVQQLVALCAELQRIAGREPFYLGTRAAGELFGVDFSTVSRWLTALCHARVLELVTKGSRGSRKVSEFRYLKELT